jgi:hypothetical protein
MATVLERPIAGQQAAVDLTGFLADLTSLSHRYGVGIADGATLFLLEREDFSRRFSADSESLLGYT